MFEQRQKPLGLPGRSRCHTQICLGKTRIVRNLGQKAHGQVAIQCHKARPRRSRAAQGAIAQRRQDVRADSLQGVGIGNRCQHFVLHLDRHVVIGGQSIGPDQVITHQALFCAGLGQGAALNIQTYC